jgi:sialate O-acetylesterase
MHKVHYIFGFILVGLLFSVRLSGQSPMLEENFDFTSQSNLSGQGGWTLGTSSANRIMVGGTGLSYPGYPGNSSGLGAIFVSATDRVQKTFTGSLSGTYYYSFLINVSSAGTGDYFIGFFSANAFRARTYIRSDGSGFQFGLAKTTSGTVAYTTGVPYSYGATYLVVVGYEFNAASGTDDKVSLYVNPDLAAADIQAPAIGPLSDTGNDVSANVLALQARTNCGNFVLDGIRVASDWATIRGIKEPNHYLELPKFIGSHMVLQRDVPMQFRGWASAGDTVVAVFTGNGTVSRDSAVTDINGRWSLTLPSGAACSQPCGLTFSLKNHSETLQSFDDILVGDVWFAGGQSNMEKKLDYMLEAAQYEKESSQYSMIRSFRASYFATNTPQEKVNGSSIPWFVCDSAMVGGNVSAVAYVFARKLNETLHIPIGIIQAYRGGTEIETWIGRDKINSDTELCKTAGRIAGMDSTDVAAYPSIHFNGQINPLKGIPLKGFIFYQGESNIKRALEYRVMLKKLIENWRGIWGMGNLPFYYVQMPNMGVSSDRNYEEGNWQDIREQQAFLLSDHVSNTGMAVSIDTNEDPDDTDATLRMHPHNKKPVGERLAHLALNQTYNVKTDSLSPELNRYVISRDTVYLIFKNCAGGLRAGTDGLAPVLKGFAISDAGRYFVTADAVIMNDSTIALKGRGVDAPYAVRYGWAKNPDCNLFNGAAMPASPFRTDNWPSGYVYGTFPSSCPLSGDAGLLFIRLNNLLLPGFTSETTAYSLVCDRIPQVNAAANSPFASVSVVQASEQNGCKATITATAENASTKVYEVVFDRVTGVSGITTDHLRVYRQEGRIVVQTDGRAYNLTLYDTLGCVLTGKTCNPGEFLHIFPMTRSGIYLLRVCTSDSERVVKVTF